MKNIREIFKRNEGFTLIELLIVIVILGILAAIAVPNLAGLTDTADESAVKANMRTLMTELEAYKAQEGNDYNTEWGAFSDLTGDPVNSAAADSLSNQSLDSSSVTFNATDSYTITATVNGTTIKINDGAITTSTTSGS